MMQRVIAALVFAYFLCWTGVWMYFFLANNTIAAVQTAAIGTVGILFVVLGVLLWVWCKEEKEDE